MSLSDGPEPEVGALTAPARQPQSYAETLSIRDGGEIVRVATANIDWIDAAGDYMCVHAGGTTHIMRSTMRELEERLDPAVFQRVHRSTLVNLQRVEKVLPHRNGEYRLVLRGGETVKMGRTYKDKVRHLR